jgi:hypothetical protein
VDAGLDENETELRISVLSVALEMLANSNGFLDQHVQVFGNFRGKA